MRLAGLLPLALCFACADAARVAAPVATGRKPPAPSSSGAPIPRTGAVAQLAAHAGVGVDDGFAKILAANDEDAQMRAPLAMRRAIGVLPMHAFAIDARFEQRKKGFALVWSATMRVDDHKEAMAAVDRELAKDGFVRTLVGRFDEGWARGEEQMTAMSATAAGHPSTFEIEWTVADAVGEGPFTLRTILDEAPWLREPRVEARIYDALGETTVLTLLSGATPRTALVRDEPDPSEPPARRATEWSIDALPRGLDDTARTLASFKATLVAAGFEWTAITQAMPFDMHEYERDDARQRAYVAAAQRDEADAYVARLVIESH